MTVGWPLLNLTGGLFASPKRAALIAACLSVAVAGESVGVQPDESVPLRVLVYNMHAGKDSDGASNLDRIASLVVEWSADVVLLQEVDQGTLRSGNENQLDILAGLTSFHSAFGKTLDFQGGEYGIAVLSRWPIQRDTLYRLVVNPAQERAGGSYEPRGALHVVIGSPFGRLHVLNTHLDPSRDDSFRLQEAEGIRNTIELMKVGSEVLLVGGDFNMEPGSLVHEGMTKFGLLDVWKTCGTGDRGFSYPSADPVKRIDYLFVLPNLRCRQATVIESMASDHRPMGFELSILDARLEESL